MLKLHADQITRAELVKGVACNLMEQSRQHVANMKLDAIDPQNNLLQALIFQGLCQLHGPISVHHTNHNRTE